jgi:nucleoside-triphosphatase THEP1
MNIMLTGPRGAGKTTVAQDALDMLMEIEVLGLLDVDGYLTDAIGDPAEPKGHVMYPLGHKPRNIAHVNSKKGPRVGPFRVGFATPARARTSSSWTRSGASRSTRRSSWPRSSAAWIAPIRCSEC